MNIPVFDALTGDLRYIFKLNIEGHYFHIPFRSSEIEVRLTDVGWRNRQSMTGRVTSKVCLADRTLLDALDSYSDDELPPWIQRLP
jgi:hypothetical protein